MIVEPWGAPTRQRPGRERSDEIDDAVRGLASGLLIGIPVVFTVDTERVAVHGDSFYVPYTEFNMGSEAISAAEIWIEVFDGE